MEIEVDYNPKPSKQFFISVAISKKEAISFDYTTKGHRVIKQVLVEKKKFPKNTKISGEWDAIVIKNSKFVRKFHVKWIDLDKKDWVNNEIWKLAWEKPIGNALKDKLLAYSHFISGHYKELGKLSGKMKKWDAFLSKEIVKYSPESVKAEGE